MKYEVTYTHTLHRRVEVEADSLAHALAIVADALHDNPSDTDTDATITSEERVPVSGWKQNSS